MCDGSGLVPVTELDGDSGVGACSGCQRCADLSAAARRAFAAADYGSDSF